MSKTVIIGTIVIVLFALTLGGFFLWQQLSQAPTQPNIQQTPSQAPSQFIGGRELPFQKVSLGPDLVLNESFESYPNSRGLFRTEAELQTIWAFTENWRTRSRAENPQFDFTQQSVIWYATKRDASFVEVEKVEEFFDFVEVKVTIVHSDFLTRELFLWSIPKTTKEIRFVERTEFNPI